MFTTESVAWFHKNGGWEEHTGKKKRKKERKKIQGLEKNSFQHIPKKSLLKPVYFLDLRETFAEQVSRMGLLKSPRQGMNSQQLGLIMALS